MKIVLDLIENKNPCTAGSLCQRIGENIEEKVIKENCTWVYLQKREPIKLIKVTIYLPKKPINISQLYSIITNAGYSIKDSIIKRKDELNENKVLLAEDYVKTKARFNPEKTKGEIVSKYNSKLTNAGVQK